MNCWFIFVSYSGPRVGCVREQTQEIGEILALIERRIEQHQFASALLDGMSELGTDGLGLEEVELVVGLGVVAELAVKTAAAGRFQ